jgi:O-antigen/teichoic acid export membrane protein
MTEDSGIFLKGAGTLYVLQFITKFSGILVSMVVTRLLTVEDYGIYVLVLSVLSLFLLVCDLGLGDAILALVPRLKQEGRQEEVRNLVSSALALRVLLGLAATTVLFLSADFIGTQFYPRIPQIPALLRIVALIPLLDPISGLMNSFLLVRKQFQVVFRVGIFTTLFKLIVIPAVVYFVADSYGAVMASCAMTIATGLVFLVICLSRYSWFFFSLAIFADGMAELRRRIRELVGFGGFLTLNNFTWLVREQAKNLLTGAYLGPGATALFNRATVLADIPIDTASAIRGAVVPFLSEGSAQGQGHLQKRYVHVTRLVILYAALVTIVMILFSDELITFFYSRKFLEASPVLAVLVSVTIMRVVGIPLVGLLTALGETQTLARVGIGFTIVFVVLIYLVVPRFALAGLSASVVISYVILIPIFAWVAQRKSGLSFPYRLLIWPFLSLLLGLGVACGLWVAGVLPLVAKFAGLLSFILVFLNLCVTDEDLRMLYRLLDRMPVFLQPAKAFVRGIDRVRVNHRMRDIVDV